MSAFYVSAAKAADTICGRLGQVVDHPTLAPHSAEQPVVQYRDPDAPPVTLVQGDDEIDVKPSDQWQVYHLLRVPGRPGLAQSSRIRRNTATPTRRQKRHEHGLQHSCNAARTFRVRTHKQDSQIGRSVIQGLRRGTVDGSRLLLAERAAIRAA
jgi:hypothetical protein